MNVIPERLESAVVARVADVEEEALRSLLSRYALRCVQLALQEKIPGSYWGECEAGVIGDTVYWRGDTPVHSVLHEACHAICMDRQRRSVLEGDAGGDFDEENAVCYLQILLADELAGVGRLRMCHDMDLWGYTFRLGSAAAWFEQDADDARRWLLAHGLLCETGSIAWRMRR